MEAEWIALSMAANALRVYVTKRCIDLFLDRSTCTWNYQWFSYVVLWGLSGGAYYLFHFPPLTALCNLVGLALVLAPYKAPWSKKILIAGLIFGVPGLIESIVVFAFTQYQFGDNVRPIYEYVTSLVFLFVEILLERTLVIDPNVVIPKSYRISLGIVPLVSIVMLLCTGSLGYQFQGTILVVMTGLLFINLLDLYLYQSIIKFYSAYLEKKAQEQMIQVYMHELGVIKESSKREREIWHDMKHHIIELQTMLKDQEIQKARNYLEDMEQFVQNSRKSVATGNQEIDGILDFLLDQARKTLTEVRTEITIPEGIFRGNFKLCTILGNLLDNAIREAKETEQKYLGVTMYTKNGILFLRIENSYKGNIIKVGDRFRTTQKDREGHGQGLENVRKMVELCKGEMDISYTEDLFKVEVLLYLKEIETIKKKKG